MKAAQVLVTEFVKLRRSKVTWVTLGAFLLGPLGLALFMWIVREPERAKQLGLLGTKASLSGLEATWPSYLSMITMVVGMGGILLLAFIVGFVFGREYVEGTAKNLLALPVERQWFVLAKLVVAAVWWALLVGAVLAEAFLIGWLLRLPGLTPGLAGRSVRDALLVAGVAFLLAPIVAWIATLGRGYLPPLGFALLMLLLAQVFGKTGWSIWFPWSIVATFVAGGEQRVAGLTAGSAVVVLATFAAGIAATIAQLRYADNVQ